MAKKPTAAPNQFQRTAQSGELSPANQMASELVTDRPDLLPSVAHIMNAGLDDPTAATALGLFRSALTAPGDPHRDPRAAVSTASGVAPAST